MLSAGEEVEQKKCKPLLLWRAVQLLQKLSMHVAYVPAVSPLGTYPREMKACKDLYRNVYSGFLGNSQKL